jgi:hypothetical protein
MTQPLTPEAMARQLNAMPSGKTGRWYPEADGSGVVYRHGEVHARANQDSSERRGG